MSEEQLPPEVVEALGRNEKIQAIKRLRELRGLGLKDAKELVDAFLKKGEDRAARPRRHTAGDQHGNSELPAEVVEALASNQNIEAIKRLRSARGIGLKEAKDLVDEFVSETRKEATTRRPVAPAARAEKRRAGAVSGKRSRLTEREPRQRRENSGSRKLPKAAKSGRSQKKTSANPFAAEPSRGIARIFLMVIAIGSVLVMAYWGYWLLLLLSR
jgi:ribosomal protein L7/L12